MHFGFGCDFGCGLSRTPRESHETNASKQSFSVTKEINTLILNFQLWGIFHELFARIELLQTVVDLLGQMYSKRQWRQMFAVFSVLFLKRGGLFAFNLFNYF